MDMDRVPSYSEVNHFSVLRDTCPERYIESTKKFEGEFKL